MASDPYKYFRIEAREILDQLGRGVLDLEKDPGAKELVSGLLRAAHTLKGAARVVKQREIAELAHAIEDALAPLRDGAPLSRDGIDTVLRIVDEIAARLAQLAAPPRAPAAAAQAAAPEPPRAPPADREELDALLEGIAETHVQLATLRRGDAALERLRQVSELLAGQLGARAAQATDAAAIKIRGLLDELRALLAAHARGIATGVDQAERELRQVRDVAERLRLAPASTIFNALERTARDAAQSLGKRVAFDGSGAAIRLDPQLLGTIQQALVQAVRNAVAHGIEPEADRLAAGKPAIGRVSIEVVRRGNRVTFCCRDDGRGVDGAAVRRAAERRGIAARDLAGLGHDELLRLLLKGGISTSPTVTDTAGRGVGLDVVREAAARLGGEVLVTSEPGRGTSLQLDVPLSLSLIEAIVVEAGGRVAAIPLDAVRQTLRLTAGQVSRGADGASIVHGDAVIPFAPLSRLVRGAAPAEADRAWSAVIVQSGAARAAIGVDRLGGAEAVALRPLPALAQADAIVAGAALGGGGDPLIVLDVDRLVEAAARPAARADDAGDAARSPILIVDDSLTTRMLEQSILESAGFEVEVATSGEEGLDKARAGAFALFLVDIEMPGIDGFTFIERTQADPRLRETPAILVSSRSSAEDRRRASSVGARGYIVKSEFDQRQLLERIRDLIR